MILYDRYLFSISNNTRMRSLSAMPEDHDSTTTRLRPFAQSSRRFTSEDRCGFRCSRAVNLSIAAACEVESFKPNVPTWRRHRRRVLVRRRASLARNQSGLRTAFPRDSETITRLQQAATRVSRKVESAPRRPAGRPAAGSTCTAVPRKYPTCVRNNGRV